MMGRAQRRVSVTNASITTQRSLALIFLAPHLVSAFLHLRSTRSSLTLIIPASAVDLGRASCQP